MKDEAPVPTPSHAASDSEPTFFRLVATLSLAGLFSGLALVGAYQLTLPRIQANQARALREAVFKILPGVARIEALAFIDGALEPSEEGAEELVYAGYDSSDGLVGYAIPGEGPGFQDTIRLLYGYQPEKRLIVGMEVLESRETPGLGDKITKDPAFKENFSALAVEPEVVAVKTGTKSAPNEVDAITGATISSKAVVTIINQANQRWVPRLSGPRSAGDGSAGRVTATSAVIAATRSTASMEKK